MEASALTVICEVTLLVALPAAHEPKISVGCCMACASIISVTPGSGRCVLPANDEAAAESTPGSLRAGGPAVAGSKRPKVHSGGEIMKALVAGLRRQS
jgi:hypothetical protein